MIRYLIGFLVGAPIWFVVGYARGRISMRDRFRGTLHKHAKAWGSESKVADDL